jgi:ABC-2 type transport system permease protein
MTPSQEKASYDLNVRGFGRWNTVGLYTFVRKEVLRFAAVYMQTIIAPVVTTLLFYMVFSLALGGDDRVMNGMPYMAFIMPGLIMMTMAQNAFANASSSIMIGKIQGSIVDVVMAPLSYFEIFLGYTIGAILRGLFIGAACIVAFALFKGYVPQDPIVLIVFGVLGASMLGVIGILAGLWAEKFDNVAVITNFVITPLTFLSGTFYSLDQLSGTWKLLALLNPFFHMIDGFRSGMTGVGEMNVLLSLAVLLVTNLALIFIALRVLKSGYKLKS